ncbi:MAG: transporter substrate-binding protein [Clostridiales bacterium]|nr:transporter substrate-binding protein [Clostridiales bacterium]
MKNFKKITAALLASVMLAASVAGCSSSPASSDKPSSSTTTAQSAAGEKAKDFKGAQLVVATWGFTAANVKDLSKKFEETYNVKVVIDETSGNSDRLNKIMAQKNNPEIDVALMTDIFAALGNEKGIFEKIDTKIVTNLNNLYDFAKNADGYGPSYSVVRYGIIYDADTVKTPPKSYKDLFSGKYNGQLSLPDMASTAGPYVLSTLAEKSGGSATNVEPGFEVLKANKDNVKQWYLASSDVQKAFSTGEIGVTVFMDMNMPSLKKAGLNVKWVDPEEGGFSAAANVNVVKNSKNPELAQLFVNYLISDAVQNQIADKLNEAPTNKNATMSDEKKQYLAYGQKAMDSLKKFDWKYINTNKAAWIEKFQKEVAVQKK